MYKKVDKGLDGQVKMEDLMGVIYQSLTDSKKQWPEAPNVPDKPINMNFGNQKNEKKM